MSKPIRRSCGFFLLYCLAFAASAQTVFPTKTVRIIVPFAAGGGNDLMGRLFAAKLGETWGQPVIVENRTGASGSIGADLVAKSAPDGHTILLTVDTPLAMFPAVAKQLPYNPLTDFKPVAGIARTSNGLFVNPALGVTTVAELIALAKAQPGRLTFSSAGIASPAHFAGELFRLATGVDLLHVPYKGSAPAMQAAISGEVSMMFGPVTQALPPVRSGKMRPLGVLTQEVSPLLPGVKTLVEQGYPGVVVTPWYPVAVAAKTPDSTVRILRDSMKRVLETPEVRERMESVGATPVWESPEDVVRNIETDLRRWSEVARRAGMQPQ